jgi:hypothetical protein
MLFSELVQFDKTEIIECGEQSVGWRILFRERSETRLHLAAGSVTVLCPDKHYDFGPAVADELVFINSGTLVRQGKEYVPGEHLWFDTGAMQAFTTGGPGTLVTTTIFGVQFTHLQLSLGGLQMEANALNFLLAKALAEATAGRVPVSARAYEEALGVMNAELWREPTSK